MKKFYTRKKRGSRFEYYDGDEKVSDQSTLDRMNALVIPPAWKDVKISASKSAKVQATGYDAAGRQQSIYHPAFRLRQEKLKFDRILRFAQHLPALRRQLQKDLARKRLGKEKVLACIVTLIDQAYFRVGNEAYARDHQTYGVTTLRSKHANITSTTVTFDFIGKSGQKHVKKINDQKLVRIIKQLDELPGYELFRYQDKAGAMHNLHAADVNAYIKEHMGEEFTAKDFRTWGGTLLAMTEMIKEEVEDEASTKTARAKALTAIVKRVAKKLGNTPAVARSSYIDPRVLKAYDDEKALKQLRGTMKNMKPRKYMSIEEQAVLKVLT